MMLLKMKEAKERKGVGEKYLGRKQRAQLLTLYQIELEKTF